MIKTKIFLSAPISAFKDEEKYLAYRDSIVSLIQRLRESYEVYSEVEQISGLDSYDEPSASALNDFNRILEADVFVLHHPARMQTSALIELGYAYAKGKNILIIANPDDLPYLALGLAEIKDSGVKIIRISQLNEKTIRRILQELNSLTS